MSVHYKFKSALDYDTLAFDGLHITVGEVKTAISQQKRIGKSSDFDLQITNAQTKEVYADDGALIPKNTSLLVARVPLAQQPKKQWPGEASAPKRRDGGPHAPGPADLSRMEGSEQDKISAMISQSTLDYDPSNYQKIRGQNQRGEVPAHYRCNRCQRPGHWISKCPTANIPGAESVDIRRSTGIPQSFMVPVDGPKAPGAMMTPTGSFAVPAVDHEAYQASETVGGEPAPENERREIPDDLICSLCRDLLTDAVMIPCCGNSFCDECIRGTLLESEDHECPDCREKEIAPTTLIPNRFLRNSVASFRNQTGYSRRAPHRAAAVAVPPAQPVAEPPPAMATQRPPNGQTQPGQPIAVSTGVGIGPGGAGVAADESDGSGEDNITVTVPPPSGGHAPRAPAPPQRPRRPYPERPYGERARGARDDRPRDDRPRDDRPRDDRPHGAPHPEHYGPPHLQLPNRDRPLGPHIGMGRMLEEQRAGTPTVDERRDTINPQMLYNRPPMYMHAAPPPHYPMGFDGPPGAPPPFAREPFPPDPFQPPPPGIKESPTLRRGEDPLEAFNRMIREKEERAKRRETERRRLHSPTRSPVRSPLRSLPRSPPRSPPPRSPPPRLRTRTRSPAPRARSPPLRVRSPPSRGSSRIRYSRSRSGSRGRRRSPPWSPRRRPPPPRERTLSLTRSPSPGRRRRSPLLRYRSPLRSPPPRSPPPRRSSPPHHSPPPSHPHHRYGAGYEDRASPPRRSVEPPHAVRYGPRSNGPPSFPPNVKSIPTLGDLPMMKEPSPARTFRGRYEEPPFEEIPPGAEPPVPGYEPPPFDNPTLPPQSFNRPPYVDGQPPYRDMAPLQRDSFRGPPQPDGFRGPPQPDGFRGPPQPLYRDGPPYRDRMPPQQFRDPNPNMGYRGGPPPTFGDAMPPQGYRGNAVPPYRDAGPPPGYRDNAPQMFRDGPPSTFRPQNIRDPVPGPLMYQEPNVRDGFRELPTLMPEPTGGRDQIRGGYRHGNRNVRGAPRRNFDSDRQRERPDREGRYGDRDNTDKTERKNNYERVRDERPRDYDRTRDVADKERERENDRSSPDRKRKFSAERTPPRRSRVVDARDKRKSESRGRSKERESKRDKKDERDRERSAETKAKDQKEKNRKEKERKKKKKEKEAEKKKKRDKKEKKDKDAPKVEDDVDTEKKVLTTIKEEPSVPEEPDMRTENTEKPLENSSIDNDLYGGIGTDVAVDKKIMETYIKIEPEENIKKEIEEPARVEKDSSFEGLELHPAGQNLESKPEEKDKEMLAPVPELSKWEMDEEQNDKFGREPGEISPETESAGKVTSEVLKRAENAIFAKAINSIKTIEIKKISNDRLKLYSDDSGEHKEAPMNNIQITVPVTNVEPRSIELTNDRKLKRSKTPVQQKLSVKDRLGGKIEDPNRNREDRFIHSTIERIKSKSKTPKRDHPYRRVTVDTRDRPRRMVENEEVQNLHRYNRQEERRIASEAIPRSDNRRPDRPADSRIDHSSIKEKARKKDHKPKKSKDDKHQKEGKHIEGKVEEKPKDEKEKAAIRPERDRKRSTLDESNFEPDYDEHVESDEGKEEGNKKRERSVTPAEPEQSEAKKAKTVEDSIPKKQQSGTDTSSDSDSSSSSSSSEVHKKKRKKKKSKRKKKKVASDSESDSDGSSSDEPKKKKKKSKHKKKSSKKKKKKSKHK